MEALDSEDIHEFRVHSHEGFVPWSMRQPDERPANSVWSSAGWYMENVPAEVACIVCFAESTGTQEGLARWHHCRTCSAMWCDSCMEGMYNVARDDEHKEMELLCPQCRKNIALMQFEARQERIMALCADADAADVLLRYENLLTECIRLTECRENGMPFYTLPLEASARILSRDEMCDVVLDFQGRKEAARLGRLLRGADFVGAAMLVLRGYLLHGCVSPASAVAILDATAEELHRLTTHASAANNEPAVLTERRAALLRGVAAELDAQRATLQATTGAAQQEQPVAEQAAEQAAGQAAVQAASPTVAAQAQPSAQVPPMPAASDTGQPSSRKRRRGS